ncbi:DUF2254 domain-containing protein [Tianweitania sediminis]|uniref:DUF2254 domain-containing protein n=1 Tax=Tianweitania sediminis TaxID=1502156 RepID=A0A8J7R232_9HYPH|nr:DUF2254 domain-containing protein [Tianweitania sediminis]
MRTTLISMVGVGAALVSMPFAALIPDSNATSIGADAADNILGIIASSMLAVTTFSLSTVVSAYSAATSNVTPRATKLLIEDSTAQTTLSVFVGVFLYSLTTLILLSTGAYGEKGRVALFLVTLVVVAIMVVTLLRWIDYLLHFGRVGETTENVEQVARRALKDRREEPYFGGNRCRDSHLLMRSPHVICSKEVGYVQYVDVQQLNAIGDDCDLVILLLGVPGQFVHPAKPLVRLSKAVDGDDKMRERILSCFSVGETRSFDQDPRFGLIVLAEIASRALSPALNDTGTAIDVLGRGVRVLSEWRPDERQEVQLPRLFVSDLNLQDLLEDFFGPIGRDGARSLEVQIRLQKSLNALHATGSPTMKQAAAAAAQRARERVDFSAFSAFDRDQLVAAHAWAAEH